LSNSPRNNGVMIAVVVVGGCISHTLDPLGFTRLADKATDLVAKETPRVLSALGRIKLFIIGIPILSVLVGMSIQHLLPERHVVIA
jgi:hypothetical protein